MDDGSRVGTLCIAGHRPRQLDDTDTDALRHLAAQSSKRYSSGRPAIADTPVFGAAT
jgi:hypothetical protein